MTSKFSAVGIFITWLLLLSAGSAAGETNSQQDLIMMEIKNAPADIRGALLSSDERLREFVVGRLLDREIVRHAVSSGLDQDEQLRTSIELHRRDTLVRAAIRAHMDAERAKMPNLAVLAERQYLANAQQYALPEAVKVAHILVRVDVETMDDEEIARRKALAQSLLKRLRAGEDFAALARQYSDDKGSVHAGGELRDFMPRDTLVPPFEDAAFALQVGELSPLVRTRFGFHVIRLIDKRPEGVQTFEEVRRSIVARLEKEWLDPRREAFINQFRSATLVQEADEIEREIRELYKSDAAAAPR